MINLVAGVNFRCLPRKNFPGVTQCWASEYELSEGMVHTGWALAMPRDHKRFAVLEKKAATARRGLWQGEFVIAWDWKLGEK